LRCYGVELTRYGRARVQQTAGEGNQDGFPVKEVTKPSIIEDGELAQGKVESLTPCPDEISYVEVGIR